MKFQNSVDDGNVSSFDFKDDDLSDTDGFLGVIRQKQQISSMECGLHTARENHDDGTLAPRNHHETFPYH